MDPTGGPLSFESCPLFLKIFLWQFSSDLLEKRALEAKHTPWGEKRNKPTDLNSLRSTTTIVCQTHATAGVRLLLTLTTSRTTFHANIMLKITSKILEILLPETWFLIISYVLIVLKFYYTALKCYSNTTSMFTIQFCLISRHFHVVFVGI